MNYLTRFFSIFIALLISVSCSSQSETPPSSESVVKSQSETINGNDNYSDENSNYDEFNAAASEEADVLADIEEDSIDIIEYQADLNDDTLTDNQDQYEVSQEEIIFGEPTTWKDEEDPELVATETEENRYEEEQPENLDEYEIDIKVEERIPDENSEESIIVTEIDENYEEDEELEPIQNDDPPSNDDIF